MWCVDILIKAKGCFGPLSSVESLMLEEQCQVRHHVLKHSHCKHTSTWQRSPQHTYSFYWVTGSFSFVLGQCHQGMHQPIGIKWCCCNTQITVSAIFGKGKTSECVSNSAAEYSNTSLFGPVLLKSQHNHIIIFFNDIVKNNIRSVPLIQEIISSGYWRRVTACNTGPVTPTWSVSVCCGHGSLAHTDLETIQWTNVGY